GPTTPARGWSSPATRSWAASRSRTDGDASDPLGLATARHLHPGLGAAGRAALRSPRPGRRLLVGRGPGPGRAPGRALCLRVPGRVLGLPHGAARPLRAASAGGDADRGGDDLVVALAGRVPALGRRPRGLRLPARPHRRPAPGRARAVRDGPPPLSPFDRAALPARGPGGLAARGDGGPAFPDPVAGDGAAR